MICVLAQEIFNVSAPAPASNAPYNVSGPLIHGKKVLRHSEDRQECNTKVHKLSFPNAYH